MTSTPDTRITLKYMTTAQLGRVSDDFKADPADDQPGWFVEATYKEGYERVLLLTRVSPFDAVEIAHAIDGAVEGITVASRVRTDNLDHAAGQRERRVRAEQLIQQGQRILAQLDAEGA